MNKYMMLTAVLLSSISESHAVKIFARLEGADFDESSNLRVSLPGPRGDYSYTLKPQGKTDDNGIMTLAKDFPVEPLKDNSMSVSYKEPGKEKKTKKTIRIQESESNRLESLTLVLTPSEDNSTLDYELSFEKLYRRSNISVMFTGWCPQTGRISITFPNGEKKDVSSDSRQVEDKKIKTIYENYTDTFSFNEGDKIQYTVYPKFTKENERTQYVEGRGTFTPSINSISIDPKEIYRCREILLIFSPLGSTAYGECKHKYWDSHPYTCELEIKPWSKPEMKN